MSITVFLACSWAIVVEFQELQWVRFSYIWKWIPTIIKSFSEVLSPLHKMLYTFLNSALILSGAVQVFGVPAVTTYSSNAQTAFTTLQKWYNQSTGLYEPSTGWWNSANCLTVLGDLAAIDPLVKPQIIAILANSFTAAQNFNLQQTKVIQSNYLVETISGANDAASALLAGQAVVNPKGFLNAYYDDEGWWAHAWIQAYDITLDPDYLNMAEDIFADMKAGASTCGGIWWDKAHTYTNAIANELYLSAASHLANRALNKQYYLTIAQQQWDWFQQSGMINSQNLINDGLTTACKNNGGTVWSYNQGVILGGLVELNKASPNSSYITTAQNIATAAINSLGSNGVLHDPCEPKCGADGSQFKGIFMRNLQELQLAAPDPSYLNFIASNAEAIWAQDRNAANELSVVWSGPFVSPANASTQSSAMDALVGAVAFGGLGISS